MRIRFLHTADIHLGKTYRTSPGEAARYEDFFRMLGGIVADAVRERVDFVLIGGDLFHTGQILPKTFARTIETLQLLKDNRIPCIAVEGNHDWIHRRDSISWMEALSQMGYIRLLRPSRTETGGYRFDPFDPETGMGGRIEIEGLNIYGLGYIGAQAGAHVARICEAVETRNNLLLFHVGVWTYSPVEIGNIKPEEALPLAECFDYVALGHGHKPYIIKTPDGRPYAFNPGSPERVNFGEERYDKGYYLVTVMDGRYSHESRPTTPRPMLGPGRLPPLRTGAGAAPPGAGGDLPPAARGDQEPPVARDPQRGRGNGQKEPRRDRAGGAVGADRRQERVQGERGRAGAALADDPRCGPQG